MDGFTREALEIQPDTSLPGARVEIQLGRAQSDPRTFAQLRLLLVIVVDGRLTLTCRPL